MPPFDRDPFDPDIFDCGFVIAAENDELRDRHQRPREANIKRRSQGSRKAKC